MNDAICQYIRRRTNLLIGDKAAERIKREIGSTEFQKSDTGMIMQISGRDLMNGVPTDLRISEAMIAESIAEPVQQIIETIKLALEATPPELALNIVHTGIVLTGGGALLRNIDSAIGHHTGLQVTIADNPLNSQIKGTGIVIENLEKWRNVLEMNSI